LREATPADLPVLAVMNKGLIEDEGSRNSMGLEALQAQMRGWLEAEDWKVRMLEVKGKPVGYVLYRVGREEHFSENPRVYLRQFYVLPDRQKQGLGRAAMGMSIGHHLPLDATVVLDVLANNRAGIAFWRGLGFRDHALTLERRP